MATTRMGVVRRTPDSSPHGLERGETTMTAAPRAVPSALRRKTDRTVTSQVVAHVTLTQTGPGCWHAQGWDICQLEDSPPYWEATHIEDRGRWYPNRQHPVYVARNRKRLVGTLKRTGHLTDDAQRAGAA
jgi:hypothetical protein